MGGGGGERELKDYSGICKGSLTYKHGIYESEVDECIIAQAIFTASCSTIL